MKTSRFIAIFAAAVAALATVGAASATAPPTSEPAPSDDNLSGEAAELFEMESEFAQCMRDNGIDYYPDPQVNEDGLHLWSESHSETRKTPQSTRPARPVSTSSNKQARPKRPQAAGWEKIVPGGDCECSDGSEFSFWVRAANPNKVVLFLQGGGNCFSAETCAPERDLYDRTVDAEDDPAGLGGIFDFADERNPFADYSVVFVPYCTGDVYIGNAITEYEPGLTVHHKGFVNGTAALDHLVAAFPDASEVVVAGESAGSAPSPLYGGLVSDRLPNARITVLADGSGAAPNSPDLNSRQLDAWGAENNLPAWPENAGLTAEQWSAQQLFIQSGRHDPDIVVRPPRLRLRRGPDRRLGARLRHPRGRSPFADRQQRDPHRGRRREPAQLHRAGRRAHRAHRRALLHRVGQRRPAGRLGGGADRR